MSKQRATPRNDRRPWIEYELMEWFVDSDPIRATDNRKRSAERVEVGVKPLEPPEFRRRSDR